jgi:hypothetical protein
MIGSFLEEGQPKDREPEVGGSCMIGSSLKGGQPKDVSLRLEVLV